MTAHPCAFRRGGYSGASAWQAKTTPAGGGPARVIRPNEVKRFPSATSRSASSARITFESPELDALTCTLSPNGLDRDRGLIGFHEGWTVTSSWFFHVRQKSRMPPARIAPGSRRDEFGLRFHETQGLDHRREMGV